MYKRCLTPLPIAIKDKLNTQWVEGFSLIEIIVSVFLIVLTAMGVINLFVAGKRLILHSHTRMTVGELGKVFLGPLQMQVRQDTWDQAGNLLQIPVAQESVTWTGSAENLNGIAFTPTYTVARLRDTASNDTGLRRLTVTTQWQEPTP